MLWKRWNINVGHHTNHATWLIYWWLKNVWSSEDFDVTQCVVHLYFHKKWISHIKSICIQSYVVSKCKDWNGPVYMVLVTAAKFVIYFYMTPNRCGWLVEYLAICSVLLFTSHRIIRTCYYTDNRLSSPSEIGNAFAWWSTMIMDSNQARGMEVFPRFSFCVCVVLCR
jgi:hypothetical protein